MKLKDKKIQILEVTRVPGSGGFTTEVWKPIHEGMLWAYYRQLSGKEFFASAQVNITEEITFTINWRNDISIATIKNLLVMYSGRYYNITRLDGFEGYKRDLDLFCKLSANQKITLA